MDIFPDIPSLSTELFSALGVGVIIVAILLLAEGWHRFFQPPVEYTRKFVHVCIGCVVASFPWIFYSPITVGILCGSFAGLIFAARCWGALGSIHGIRRRSYGDLLYGLSVMILFFLGREYPVFYFVSMITLTISDSLAALLGKKYHSVMFSVERDKKSLEGSAVFFLSTFLVVHLPLLLMTPMDRFVSVLVALQAAIVVTCFEAISEDGIDNFTIPIGTFVCVFLCSQYDSFWLISQLLVQLLLIGLISVVGMRVKFLAVSGGITIQVFLFGAYTLGGKFWLVPPLIAIAIFGLVYKFTCNPKRGERYYRVAAVFYVVVGSGVLYLVNNLCEKLIHLPMWLRVENPFFVPFVGVCAAQGAVAIYRLIRKNEEEKKSLFYEIVICAVIAGAHALFLILPSFYWLLEEVHLHDWIISLSILTVALAIHLIVDQRSEGTLSRIWEHRQQGLCVCVALLLLLPLHLYWVQEKFQHIDQPQVIFYDAFSL